MTEEKIQELVEMALNNLDELNFRIKRNIKVVKSCRDISKKIVNDLQKK